MARIKPLDEEVSHVTDDNEGTQPTQSGDLKETPEDPELRTDGGQTIASSPATGGASSPVEPDGAPSTDGPAIGRSSNDGPISAERDDGAFSDGSQASGNDHRTESVVLQPFQELCGRLEAIRRKDHDVVLILSSGTLRFPLGSQEARLCLNEFEGREGSQVRVLRTPNTAKPLFVAVD